MADVYGREVAGFCFAKETVAAFGEHIIEQVQETCGEDPEYCGQLPGESQMGDDTKDGLGPYKRLGPGIQYDGVGHFWIDMKMRKKLLAIW